MLSERSKLHKSLGILYDFFGGVRSVFGWFIRCTVPKSGIRKFVFVNFSLTLQGKKEEKNLERFTNLRVIPWPMLRVRPYYLEHSEQLEHLEH